MRTLIIHHDDCLRHDPGQGHPEQVRRIAAVLSALKPVANLEYLPAPLATAEQIARTHPLEYLQQLEAAEPAEGRVALDPDTFLSPGSVRAALRGSGAVCFAIDQVLGGHDRNAFCVTRPPGHHAETATAMGFCLFNHVAIGARHAQAVHGIRRVAILDFDVHHGNGTQQIFQNDPDVMYVSSHQMPLYPGGGYPDETGVGNILNLALPPESGSEAFRSAWSRVALPAVRAFNPELLLVSAGFDAHAADPLAQLQLHETDYHWITSEILKVARECCSGHVISTLEGGYDLEALGACARAHVEALISG